jgi:hypothetical protein
LGFCAAALVAASCGGSGNGAGDGSSGKRTRHKVAFALRRIDINETPVGGVRGGTIQWAVDQFSTQSNYS